jgi:uncharacterized protein (TIGR02996 family)
MADRQAFFRAIEADPEADAPRLVFADWLEENGDPDWAAAVRAACGPDPDLHVTAEMEATVHARFAGVRKLSGNVLYARGLTDRITLRADRFIRSYPAVAALCPAHHVRINGVKGKEEAVAGCEHLRHVRWLDLESNKLNADGIARFVRSPHLGTLDRLAVNNNVFGNAGAAAIATADLPNLSRFTAQSDNVRDAGLAALFGSRTLGRVTHWNLQRNHLTPAGYAAMAASARLADVTDLDLSWCGHGAAGAAAVAGSPHAAGLRVLKLHGIDDPDAGYTALAESPHLGRLERAEVWMAERRPGTDGIRALFGSTTLASLAGLDLAGNWAATADTLLAVARGRGLPALRALDIGYWLLDVVARPADRAAFEAFARSRRLAGLTRLRLQGIRLGAAGAELLAGSKAVRRLEHLDVANTGLTTAAVRTLAASRHLTGLRSLDLGGNRLTPAAARAVLDSSSLGGLRRLTLPLTAAGPSVRPAFERRLGHGLTVVNEHGNPV